MLGLIRGPTSSLAVRKGYSITRLAQTLWTRLSHSSTAGTRRAMGNGNGGEQVSENKEIYIWPLLGRIRSHASGISALPCCSFWIYFDLFWIILLPLLGSTSSHRRVPPHLRELPAGIATLL